MICLADSPNSWHFPRLSNLPARAVHQGWASHTCRGCGHFLLWEISLPLALLRVCAHPTAYVRVALRGGLWLLSGVGVGRTQAEMVLYLARPGPGTTQVTSGVEAGWAWSDTGSLPAPRQNLIMLPSPAQSSFVRRGRRWGLAAGSGHHSLEGRAGGPAVAWISA